MKKQELHFHRDVINGPDAHVANVVLPDSGGLRRGIRSEHVIELCTLRWTTVSGGVGGMAAG